MRNPTYVGNREALVWVLIYLQESHGEGLDVFQANLFINRATEFKGTLDQLFLGFRWT